jgi:hypothetical protein
VKALAISTARRDLPYLSQSGGGKTHDYRLLHEEFPCEEEWFKQHRVRVDLGFQGIEKDYQCEEVCIPHKKPKKQELTEEQKEENKKLASQRIRVEHALSGLKRYRILVDQLRLRDYTKYDVILGVCAGLWNFYLTC